MYAVAGFVRQQAVEPSGKNCVSDQLVAAAAACAAAVGKHDQYPRTEAKKTTGGEKYQLSGFLVDLEGCAVKRYFLAEDFAFHKLQFRPFIGGESYSSGWIDGRLGGKAVKGRE